MGKSQLTYIAESEADTERMAGHWARTWRAIDLRPLVIGLRGDLGSGKTTWARAMLRGLGYEGRVPSPTYTLLEEYRLDGLRVVHLDLYRLADAAELEHLGIRDCLAAGDAWLLAEWPERSPALLDACDLLLDLTIDAPDSRKIVCQAQTKAGIRALEAIADL